MSHFTIFRTVSVTICSVISVVNLSEFGIAKLTLLACGSVSYGTY
jgi:hypothetical protein